MAMRARASYRPSAAVLLQLGLLAAQATHGGSESAPAVVTRAGSSQWSNVSLATCDPTVRDRQYERVLEYLSRYGMR